MQRRGLQRRHPVVLRVGATHTQLTQPRYVRWSRGAATPGSWTCPGLDAARCRGAVRARQLGSEKGKLTLATGALRARCLRVRCGRAWAPDVGLSTRTYKWEIWQRQTRSALASISEESRARSLALALICGESRTCVICTHTHSNCSEENAPPN